VDLDGEPIGFTGLSVPWFRDGVEVGWRIRSEHWGNGYAPEAATECLRYAFDTVGLDEVISFTAAINDKSRRVMDKIGMVRDPDADFEHPGVPEGSPLRPHVLYRITREGYGAAL
jgi:RimJ/RimL family protein N-acetyltransferase